MSKMSIRVLLVYIKYSMCDLICEVITCCIWSCDMGKINIYEKIGIEIQKKRENVEIKEIFHKSPS